MTITRDRQKILATRWDARQKGLNDGEVSEKHK